MLFPPPPLTNSLKIEIPHIWTMLIEKGNENFSKSEHRERL